MKILVDREDIDNVRESLSKIRYHLEHSQYIERTVVKDLTIESDDCLLKMFRNNPEIIDRSLEDEINQQLASYNPWHNPTDKPSDITDEDRKWADKEIEKHQDTPYLATEMIIDGLARQFDNKQAMDLIGRLDIAVYHLIQAKYSLSDNPEPDAEIDTAIKRIDSVIRELKREYDIVGFEPERRGEEQ